jgi:hypothetical protein
MLQVWTSTNGEATLATVSILSLTSGVHAMLQVRIELVTVLMIDK